MPVYYLDTDLDENTPEDREITSHLYGGDWDQRLKQEAQQKIDKLMERVKELNQRIAG